MSNYSIYVEGSAAYGWVKPNLHKHIQSLTTVAYNFNLAVSNRKIARMYNARVIVGNVYEDKEKIVECIPGGRLRIY